MSVKELRAKTGMSQSNFSARFGIPLRTLQHWEQGRQDPPPYVVAMIEQILNLEKDYEKAVHERDLVFNELKEIRGRGSV